MNLKLDTSQHRRRPDLNIPSANAAFEAGERERRRHKIVVCGLMSGGTGLIAAQFLPFGAAVAVAILVAAICWESVEVR